MSWNAARLLILIGCTLTGRLAAQPSATVWLDAEGAPLPFKSDAEVLDFLSTAKPISAKKVGEGINQTQRIVLEKDGIRMRAAFRAVRRDRQYEDPRHESAFVNQRDDYIFEVAAYRLSVALGLNFVPPTVVREIDGQEGSLQAWVEKALMEKDRRSKDLEPPDNNYWVSQWLNMHFFDNLVANTDRHQGNLLIDPHWRLWLIDHTQCFSRRQTDIHDPERVVNVGRSVFERLRGLTPERIRAEYSDVLRKPEIDSLIKRRQELIRRIEKLIAQRGEEQVLFSMQ